MDETLLPEEFTTEFGVYCIKVNDNIVYVGQTIRPFYERWGEHKRLTLSEKPLTKQKKLYGQLRQYYKRGCRITCEALDSFSCEEFPHRNKYFLAKYEEEAINKYRPLLNYVGQDVPYKVNWRPNKN